MKKGLLQRGELSLSGGCKISIIESDGDSLGVVISQSRECTVNGHVCWTTHSP